MNLVSQAVLRLSLVSLMQGRKSSASVASPPTLAGQHFRITAVEEGSYLKINDFPDGSRTFDGYLIHMLEAISRSDRGNFTYDLLTPSGYGSMCRPRIVGNNSKNVHLPFGQHYRQQYHCATSDVTDSSFENTSFAPTDMYWGCFYITQERLLRSHFTIPFAPPYKGTPAMFGTAIRIPNISDLVRQQQIGLAPPACIYGASATADFLESSFPNLQFTEFFGTEQDVYESIRSGECPIHIFDAPLAAQFVARRKENGECFAANGMPMGIIGDPMAHGLTHYAFGVRKDLPYSVVDTLSYWINFLMVCEEQSCPDGNLETYSVDIGRTGTECGYVLYPPEPSRFSINTGQMVGIIAGIVVLVLVPFLVWHFFRIRSQKRRFKKRFVQQIARNIQIGSSPGEIPPDQLAKEILHIGKGKGTIGKEDLRQWIQDVKMSFISESDFDALWNAMDIEEKGVVDPVQFIVFLSACGPEFELVYNEQKKLPKSERIKLAARRLSNISLYGEAGVRQMENRLEKNRCAPTLNSIGEASSGIRERKSWWAATGNSISSFFTA